MVSSAWCLVPCPEETGRSVTRTAEFLTGALSETPEIPESAVGTRSGRLQYSRTPLVFTLCDVYTRMSSVQFVQSITGRKGNPFFFFSQGHANEPLFADDHVIFCDFKQDLLLNNIEVSHLYRANKYFNLNCFIHLLRGGYKWK